ncbi:hypothetical protein J43TS9_51550 [Paenibacillus cineris]|nr:hypothetical protein J43TS9_51550 [Paenibacillus cineris]
MALGKRCELSFEEINLFRASDLLEYAKILTEKDDDKPKEATQADIDAFYGR